ncbi:RING-H2 finger protein [Vigna angularis]|uniref:RING-type E3 ubiquitin transferase n=2 Tax=Phaseolus angularis TaxID=3914 RepID=A0A8T0LBE2_PHAAN|nr:RING-H2 finger protein ATL47 [Vigna angularis]KAG2408128.1 RING-H2 finger protein [Vigna angularis]BAT76115.1 hypothetical protein VIGAN_01407500 [Vigna angularis var. angularis]
MRNIQIETKQNGDVKYSYESYPQSPFSAYQAPNDGNTTNEQESTTPSSLSRISPLILLVIIILAVIFFVYGLVHLVLWFFMKTPTSSSIYNSNRFHESMRSRVLQRQLQQLFRLHDSGIDQALIDALPVFHYQDLLGSKEPFDCAVCLCEFSEDDKLRLLPMCTHAFHMTCLDTWLLSNSTCPLCRASLSNYVENQNENENPILFNVGIGNSNSLVLPSGVRGEEENGFSESERSVGKRVFSVRLGKFRNNGMELGNGDSCSLNERRCYSMGSYRYVVRDSNLQVVLSESGDVSENENVKGKRISDSTKGESFSVSKIWLWSKNHTFHASNAPFP